MREVEKVIPEEFINQKVLEIRKIVGSEKALAAVSGGVDSSTCAALAHKAIREQLETIFIDDGLMREGETEKVRMIFAHLGLDLEIIETQTPFFESLAGKIDPEEKRKAFRETFYQTLAQEAQIRQTPFLIQGTIKADVIETAGGIKTQHNVLEQIGINPQKYGFQVIEPLKNLFKDQVREVAKILGFPREVYERMPFPGPGLATRVVGEVTPQRVEIVRKATEVVEREIIPFKPFQALAVLLTDQATGIKDGKRIFGNIIVVRSVESKDALTAQISEIPWKTLNKIQKEITTQIPEVSRVLFDLTPKPPATIEYI